MEDVGERICDNIEGADQEGGMDRCRQVQWRCEIVCKIDHIKNIDDGKDGDEEPGKEVLFPCRFQVPQKDIEDIAKKDGEKCDGNIQRCVPECKEEWHEKNGNDHVTDDGNKDEDPVH